jgi:GT2 family glycosyltransferase
MNIETQTILAGNETAGYPENNSLLSIIIVNYNGRHFLADCLDSIAEINTCPHEIILVDNASVDDSCNFVRENYPDVHLIESKVNTGFTGGNNLGAQHARGRILLLLNNDTKLLTDIAPILREFDDPVLGVLGCRLFYGDGRQQHSYGYEHTPSRLVLSWLGLGGISFAPNCFRRNQMRSAAYELSHDRVSWVSGAFLMTPKALWDRLGGLDNEYFMYVEDVDYCKRARDEGYRIAYTPHAQVIHYEGSGKIWLGNKALSNSMRSYIRYARKFYGSFATLFIRMSLAAVMLFRSMVYGITSLLTGSEIMKDKNKAYLSASLNLIKG